MPIEDFCTNCQYKLKWNRGMDVLKHGIKSNQQQCKIEKENFMMLVGNKRVLLYTLPSVALAVSAFYLLLPPQLKLSYVLDAAHLAEKNPERTEGGMTCPQCGSKLKGIILISADPQWPDQPWRCAYYCRQEDIFWVADMPGLYFAGWYGPFDAYWRITNTIATSIAIISGVALVLVTIWDRGLMKRAPIHNLLTCFAVVE